MVPFIRSALCLIILAAIAVAVPAPPTPMVTSTGNTVGLIQTDPSASAGYTLFAPMKYTTTYLIDIDGNLVNSWDSSARPGLSAYLLDNGDLLRTASNSFGLPPAFNAGGAGGRVEQYSWDGALLWEYDYSTAAVRHHHDVEYLPSGNVLLVAWELVTEAEALAAGRDPSLLSDSELWPDHIIEVQPTGASGGTIVWEWHAFDHLIQDCDNTKANFGVVADHPELIDLNFATGSGGADWLHVNAVEYSADFDQIMLTVHNLSEIWVIDHSTTTTEAAGHTGGASGAGGDLLYRWGNPRTYDAGTVGDQMLFVPHDGRWIPTGSPGAGNILIFSNGLGRPGGNSSSVEEITPPVNASGEYTLTPGSAFGPSTTAWTYAAATPSDFYAQNISGAHRLPNGNTLICDGPQGTFFEVTSAEQTVWEYINPVTATGPVNQGYILAADENSVFRATRYAPDFAGFDGRDLTPGGPIEITDTSVSGQGLLIH